MTKKNSIEGCKKKGVTIIYTWASNLLKTEDMEVGAVSFKNHSLVVNMHVEKKNDILNEIMKTKSEDLTTDLKKEHEDFMKVWRKEQEAKKEREKKAKEEEEKRKLEEKE